MTKNPEDKVVSHVCICITPKELDAIKVEAAKLSIAPSAYARRIIRQHLQELAQKNIVETAENSTKIS